MIYFWGCSIADLIATTAGMFPIVLLIFQAFFLGDDASFNDFIQAIAVAIIGYFVGKPSDKTLQIEQFLEQLSGAKKIREIIKEIDRD